MRSKPSLLIALLLVALGAGGLAAPALAVSPHVIITDCSHSETGELTRTYTKRDLAKALKDIDGDTAEYTSCYDAISTALRARSARTGGEAPDATDPESGAGNGGDAGSSGEGGIGPTAGGTPPGGGLGGGTASGAPGDGSGVTPAPAAPVTPQAGSNAPVQLDGRALVPDIAAVVGDDGHPLPPALIGFLALLAAGTLGVAGTTIGRRVLERRRA